MRHESGPRDAPLRVALDAHMVGEEETGNETYMVNLIRGLATTDTESSLLLYTPHPSALDDCGPLPPNFAIRRVRPAPSPLRIPLDLPWRALRDRVDVLNVTYFAPPIAPGRSPTCATASERALP